MILKIDVSNKRNQKELCEMSVKGRHVTRIWDPRKPTIQTGHPSKSTRKDSTNFGSSQTEPWYFVGQSRFLPPDQRVAPTQSDFENLKLSNLIHLWLYSLLPITPLSSLVSETKSKLLYDRRPPLTNWSVCVEKRIRKKG